MFHTFRGQLPGSDLLVHCVQGASRVSPIRDPVGRVVGPHLSLLCAGPDAAWVEVSHSVVVLVFHIGERLFVN